MKKIIIAIVAVLILGIGYLVYNSDYVQQITLTQKLKVQIIGLVRGMKATGIDDLNKLNSEKVKQTLRFNQAKLVEIRETLVQLKKRNLKVSPWFAQHTQLGYAFLIEVVGMRAFRNAMRGGRRVANRPRSLWGRLKVAVRVAKRTYRIIKQYGGMGEDIKATYAELQRITKIVDSMVQADLKTLTSNDRVTPGLKKWVDAFKASQVAKNRHTRLYLQKQLAKYEVSNKGKCNDLERKLRLRCQRCFYASKRWAKRMRKVVDGAQHSSRLYSKMFGYNGYEMKALYTIYRQMGYRVPFRRQAYSPRVFIANMKFDLNLVKKSWRLKPPRACRLFKGEK